MSNEIEKTMPNQTPTKSHFFSWNRVGMIFLIIAISALFLGAYFAYCQVAKSYARLNHAVLNLQVAQQENEKKDLPKNLDLALQSIQQLQNDVNQMQQTLTQAQAGQDDKDALNVAEAHYYVKLANRELQYADNIPLAITLLKLADETVRPLSDPKLDDLRKALASDISNLQGVPEVDVTGLYMRLIALNNQIDQLQLPNKITAEQKIADAKEVQENQSWWKRGLESTWQALQKIVVVRYNQNGALPLVAPDQQLFLYQNLHAMIEQSIWALLHHQTPIYQTSLQQVTVWVKQYFVPDSSVTQAVINELIQLQAIDIYPKKPDISASLQAFDSVNHAVKRMSDSR